jgi:hypothetical protein
MRVFIQQNENANEQQDNRETNIDAIIGFFCSMVCLLLIPAIFVGAGALIFLFAPLGIIFCSVSISEINNEPLKYKGKKYAIAGIIICGVILIVTLILVLFVLNFKKYI